MGREVTISPFRVALPRWFPLVVLAAAWLAHGGVLAGDWVLDDADVVRDSAAVHAGLPDVLAADAWRGRIDDGVWRPLTLLSFSLESALWGGDGVGLQSFGFHLTNLLLHGFVSLLVLLLGASLLPDRPLVTGTAALVFAVHPVNVGAVAPLVGRADLLAGLLLLATALLWIRALRRAPALLPLAALLFFLALLAKESAAGFVVVLAGLALFVGAPRWRRAAAFLLLAGVLVGWLLFRPAAFPPVLEAVTGGFAGLARGVLALLVPVALVRDRLTLGLPFGQAGILLGALFLLVCGAAWAWMRGLARDARPAAALTLFGLSFLVGALLAPVGAPLETRFLYVFSFPALLVLGVGVEALVGSLGAESGRFARASIVLVPLVLGLGVLTREEVAVWADDITFQRALVHDSPLRPELELRYARRLLVRAANALDRLATLPSADDGTRRQRALTVQDLEEANLITGGVAGAHPEMAEAWRLRGTGLWLQGRAAEAEHSLREGLRRDPYLKGARSPGDLPASHRLELADTYYRLGLTLDAQGRGEVAAEYLKIAARLAPLDGRILARAGRASIRAGRAQAGLVLLRRAIDRVDDPIRRRALEREFDQAREAARRRADAATQHARLAENEADYRSALSAYEDALVADPSRLDAYLRLAWLRGEYFGDFRRARALLETARTMLEGAGGDVDALGRIERALEKLNEQQRETEAEEEAGG